MDMNLRIDVPEWLYHQLQFRVYNVLVICMIKSIVSVLRLGKIFKHVYKQDNFFQDHRPFFLTFAKRLAEMMMHGIFVKMLCSHNYFLFQYIKISKRQHYS